jgi:hypothetical protein
MLIEPESSQLVGRRCGGWPALAPKGASLKIGVSADNRDAAQEK